jgi:biotin transport system substrate-specific component
MSVAGVPVARPLVLSDLVRVPLVREVVLVLAWAGVVGASAQVSFPLPGTPVPFTLQTFAVLLGGAALGLAARALSLGLYLAIGAAGVPWYANGASGLGGPTFGYVVGFVAAAALVGYLAGRGGRPDAAAHGADDGARAR